MMVGMAHNGDCNQLLVAPNQLLVAPYKRTQSINQLLGYLAAL